MVSHVLRGVMEEARTLGDWTLMEDGTVRHGANCECPLVAVANSRLGSLTKAGRKRALVGAGLSPLSVSFDDYTICEAASYLGLEDMDTSLALQAADNTLDGLEAILVEIRARRYSNIRRGKRMPIATEGDEEFVGRVQGLRLWLEGICE